MAGCSAGATWPTHRAQMEEHGIAPIDLVAVNLYPFEATVAQGAGFDDCIENIDIGGPAMIRSAAKNHAHVAVLTEPAQLAEVQAEIEAQGGTTLALRRRLAAAAYARTAAYDAAISGWFAAQQGEEFPPRLAFAGVLQQTLRYGENPHQRAGLLHGRHGAARHRHRRAGAGQGAVLQQPERHRRRLRMRRRVRRARPSSSSSTPTPAASRWPTTSPPPGTWRCAATRSRPSAASSRRTGRWTRRRPRRIAAIFTEVVVAPDADEAARAVFARKKNLRLLLTGGLPDPAAPGLAFRSVAGGFLAQSRDAGRVAEADAARGDAARADARPRWPTCSSPSASAST